ncbi:twin-arginine translocase TatA/TatE family subunit [Clostridium sp. DJ247]|uniref:twin-arginine translocase TatA/TatE family subunit n=1 Tax=Clostridium sp. DJ247 TaxID=2726188 RepID=UPI0016245D67|nr:twin-arginine translocase TatA/TatE family subunit [Clostridium sp. DJ247]MBC2582451.1 twin-arginine translocase TatA/TatE family subunit [Clostridium sp. DJ247]
MPRIGFPELIIILVIALVIFGPGKLPSVGKSIGESIKEFKKASSELTKDDTAAAKNEEKKEA